MDFVPVKKQNEENYIWFILLGLMVLAIVGLGAFMIINKVKKV
jgi:LPXTG-motif cell wall-anchored protein